MLYKNVHGAEARARFLKIPSQEPRRHAPKSLFFARKIKDFLFLLLNEAAGPKDPPEAGKRPQEPILSKMTPQDTGNHAPNTLFFTRKIEHFMFYYSIRDLLVIPECAPR